MSTPVLFTVLRPCKDASCEEDTWTCSCAAGIWGVEVEVDELTEAERSDFFRDGTDLQKNEVRAYEGAGDAADEVEGPDMDAAMDDAA